MKLLAFLGILVFGLFHAVLVYDVEHATERLRRNAEQAAEVVRIVNDVLNRTQYVSGQIETIEERLDAVERRLGTDVAQQAGD